jgi:phosphatidylserine decarboxylase
MAEKIISWREKLFSWLFSVLPHHFLSRIVYYLTRIKGPLNKPVIRWFIRKYKVDMADAVIEDIGHYPNFNEFFVRALKPVARPLAMQENAIISPVDGTVSECGNIMNDYLIQAKGHFYSVEDLLGGDKILAKMFSGGRFATLYLAPYNYHRIHMPIAGRLKQMIHVPGRLFSVAPWTVRQVPRLFARNERLICLFSTPSGPLAMILVGAMNVAAIETVWSGLVTPPMGKKISEYDYSHTAKDYVKGAEMGRFNMGSTVILLTTEKVVWANALKAGLKLKMGQAIGRIS